MIKVATSVLLLSLIFESIGLRPSGFYTLPALVSVVSLAFLPFRIKFLNICVSVFAGWLLMFLWVFYINFSLSSKIFLHMMFYSLFSLILIILTYGDQEES